MPDGRNLTERLKIEYLSPDDLRPSPHNAREHADHQIPKLVKSMKSFGFLVPALVSDGGEIITGHARVLAAKKAGIKLIPVIRANNLSEVQRRAFMLADNRLAEVGSSWDREKVASELQAIIDLGLEEIEVTGFALGDIDLRLDEANEKNEPAPGPEDEIPPVKDCIVSRPGDLWTAGPHRILCADALNSDTYSRLLQGELVDCVITDPPFNLAMRSISRLGKHQHPDFATGHGEMSEPHYIGFLVTFLTFAVAAAKSGSIFFVFMDWRHLFELQCAVREVGLTVKNLAVWVKRNAGMGTFYRSRHEMIMVLKQGEEPHLNTFELGQHGRHRSNVWEYAGNNSFHHDRDAELAMHPTAKPVALLADALRDVTRRNGLVLDPFGGSGSLLIAAEKTGRRARVIELDPRYCDVMVRRYEAYTGKKVYLESSGLSFEETRLERTVGFERAVAPAHHSDRSGG